MAQSESIRIGVLWKPKQSKAKTQRRDYYEKITHSLFGTARRSQPSVLHGGSIVRAACLSRLRLDGSGGQ